jgi:hypothetical protein
MTRIELSVSIAAEPGRVAAFFVPQRMPYWYGTEMDAELCPQDGAADFRVGQKVRITGRVLRREVTLMVVITRSVPSRLLEWKFRDEFGIRGLQRWEINAESGGTLLRMTDEFALPADGRLAKLAEKFWMRPGVARRDRAALRKLKQLAERT